MSTCAQIGALLNEDRGSEERRIAICVVDDLLEHSPAGRTKYMPQLIVGGGRPARAQPYRPHQVHATSIVLGGVHACFGVSSVVGLWITCTARKPHMPQV
eukprot:1158311-Pelagomonas_calceolata.AAC.16